eukprot:TRINITY_DN70_c0_g1_i1.p1 TRINITY_DN70_c0_g1~~TRINITY_DN70_c0_g1_i1.p1  ORF type:complete len:606 (+),score=122.79 TRINITY_DN70_c0_g1_i1:111-1928(+)
MASDITNDQKNLWELILKIHDCDSIARNGPFLVYCNSLYDFSDEEIEDFIPQLCNRVLKDKDTSSLVRYLMDKCRSLHLSLKVYFCFSAAAEDACFPHHRTLELTGESQMSAANSTSRTSERIVHFRRLSGEDEEALRDAEEFTQQLAQVDVNTLASLRYSRRAFFHAQVSLYSALSNISSSLAKRKNGKNRAEINLSLHQQLQQLEKELVVPSIKVLDDLTEGEPGLNGYYLPLIEHHLQKRRILTLLPEEAFCLSSRDRVPYMLFFLTKPCQLATTEDHQPEHSIQEKDEEKIEEDDSGWVMMKDSVCSPMLDLGFRELWKDRESRIIASSPFKTIPGVRLDSVIVKAGDDLRQEQLAMQLIKTLRDIFVKSELSLWLAVYQVVAVSSTSGFMETIKDAVSLDTLKKRLPNMQNLLDYFKSVYGAPSSMSFLQAQRNFVESLAGYSLVCYLLQIKDRHNGNILIDKQGHIIHIDYGFMLTSSPGSINFETAPFKLTNEFLELMGGVHHDMFAYFKLLLLKGFLQVRREWKKIILMVDMMLPAYKMGCFAGREQTVRQLYDRFQLQLNDQQVQQFVDQLISESIGNWRTEKYDAYQYFRNGILV